MTCWHFTPTETGLRLHRPGRNRMDFSVQTTLPHTRSKRLAHQIRQDLWRALQSLRGFTPIVEIEGDVIKAGGQVDGRVNPKAIAITKDLLSSETHRQRWLRHSLILLSGLCLTPQMADAQTLSCSASHPYFCANMHVSCAGRSSRETVDFNVTLSSNSANVSTHQASQNMQVTLDRGAQILRDGSKPGYIRIMEDGRFAQRIYAKTGALMAIGHCQETQPQEPAK